jgi:hypothetical protein
MLKKHSFKCPQCRQPFTATREDARYCSCRCRVAAHRRAPPGTVWARVPIAVAEELAQRPVNDQTGHGQRPKRFAAIVEYSTKEANTVVSLRIERFPLRISRTVRQSSRRAAHSLPNLPGRRAAQNGAMPPKPPRLFTPSLPDEYARLTPESRTLEEADRAVWETWVKAGDVRELT